MASTVLPNGIIIPEKYSRDWYADLYHNWQELDNLLGGGTPKDGTLTIQKNGTTVGTFSANQATNETINITVPDVNDATLTIQKNGTTVDTFTANSSSDKTVNISVPTKTSDLNNDSGFITGVTWNDVSNKPSFATVATSGSYTDLSNKPTIPTVNNATLTIQQNGTNVQTFTANQATAATANIQCVDLTNNQTVGGIKTFSNAPVVGSINLDGKTIDTDANGNMTFNGNELLTSAIKESNFGNSNGWCLLHGGLLIQWGTVSSANLQFTVTFLKPYSVAPLVVANYGDAVNYNTPCAVVGSITNTNFEMVHTTNGAWRVNWIAIGR